MAEEYGVKLRVTADAAEAKREMDDLLEGKAARVREAGSRAGSGVGAQDATGIGARAEHAAGRLAAQEFTREAARGGAGQALAREFARGVSGGDAGRAIGRAIAGFALHQGLGAALAWMKTPGGDNTNAARFEGAAGGALRFGTAGAMMGGGVGAAIGALVGGVTGLVQKLGEERREAFETRRAMNETAAGARQTMLDGVGGEAKRRLTELQGVDFLKRDADALGRRQYRAAQELNALAGRDRDSDEYRRKEAEFQRVTAMYTAARGEEYLARMRPAATPFEARDFADDFSRRGLYAGSPVDVSAANQPILQRQERMVQALEKLVELANAGAGERGENLVEAFRTINASF